MAEHPKPREAFQSTFEEEGFTDSVVRTVKTKGLILTSLGVMGTALGYGYWRYKTKGFLVSPSMFLMQLRVGTQAAVVGCLTLGMIYNIINTHVLKKKD